jgi:hypothetical protein
MWFIRIESAKHAAHRLITVNAQMLELDLITAWHENSPVILNYVI